MVQSDESNSLPGKGFEKFVRAFDTFEKYFYRFTFILGYNGIQTPNSINIFPPFKIEASSTAVKTINVLMAALLTVAADAVREDSNEGLNRTQNIRNNPSLMLTQSPTNSQINQQLTFKLLNFIIAKKYVFASGALSQFVMVMLLQNLDPMNKAALQTAISMVLEPTLAYAAPKGAALCHAAFFNLKERIQDTFGERANYTPISEPTPSGLELS